MKFARVLISVVAAVVFSANVGFADVTVENTNTNTVDATGGNAEQNQKQKQQQQQNQGQSVTTPRNHIVAPLLNAYVGAPVADSKGWKAFICEPLFLSFSIERIENMRQAGSFWDRKGSVIDALFAKDVRAVVHEKFSGKVDSRPIARLDWVPQGQSDKLLGEFECQGDYGWPAGASLARCLYEAKQRTNTTRVVVWMSEEKDGKNSGFSIGTGGAASKVMGGNSGDDTAISVALGGLIGSTYSSIEKRYNVKLWAFNDGSIDPPAGLNVCGVQQSLTVSQSTVQTVTAACSPEEVQRIYSSLEENRVSIYGDGGKKKGCDLYSLNNLRLRSQRGDLFYRLYKCTGDKEALHKAIENYEIAARNYRFGHDIKKHRVKADRIIAQVFESWAKTKKEVLP